MAAVPSVAPRSRFSPARANGGFTLTELLVALGIVLILSALLIPLLGNARNKADRTRCLSNLRQLCAAARIHANENDGKYPCMKVFYWDSDGYLADTSTPDWYRSPTSPSIGEVLGPFLGTGAVKTLDVPPETIPPILRCPAAQKNRSMSWINKYAAYRYNGYAADRIAPGFGAARAMLFMDTAWPDWKPEQFSHQNSVGINVAYADGHVEQMPYRDYMEINPHANGEYQGKFFTQGWIEQ